MSKVTRLAGAILAQSDGQFYLVGELKEPCDFAAAGFKTPPESDPDHPVHFKLLEPVRPISIDGDYLEMEVEGEALAELLYKRFIIERNLSVSDRLWRVAAVKKNEAGITDARWLEQMPDAAWQVVRDSMLKCV
ncbi:MAG: precorrin-3B C(17)-methyltransferase [Candidatus Omnitrophica bacterium]|nr:precorrin-3B C(17)-methyltransferase [Candidatus Omnitrophota bacterium]